MKTLVVLLSSMILSAGQVWAGCPHWGGMGGHGYAGCPMGGRGVVLYLLTLALGWWLLKTADKENGRLIKRAGQVVAWIVLLVSLFGLLCKGGSAVCRKYCPDHGDKAAMSCHPGMGGMGMMMPAGHPPIDGGEAGEEASKK